MQIDTMVLADAATAAQGKLYIHGAGWDTLFVASFPVSHPAMSVAILLRVPWHDTNQRHQVALDVEDEDGQSILPMPPGAFQGEIVTGRPPTLEPGDDQLMSLALQLNTLTFNRPGRYAVIIRIDGMEAKRASFRVKLVQGALGP